MEASDVTASNTHEEMVFVSASVRDKISLGYSGMTR